MCLDCVDELDQCDDMDDEDMLSEVLVPRALRGGFAGLPSDVQSRVLAYYVGLRVFSIRAFNETIGELNDFLDGVEVQVGADRIESAIHWNRPQYNQVDVDSTACKHSECDVSSVAHLSRHIQSTGGSWQ